MIRPEEHLGLVATLAGRHPDAPWAYDDLFAAGSLALVEAARTFDPDRGVQWSTYAGRAIHRSFLRLRDEIKYVCTVPQWRADRPARNANIERVRIVSAILTRDTG